MKTYCVKLKNGDTLKVQAIRFEYGSYLNNKVILFYTSETEFNQDVFIPIAEVVSIVPCEGTESDKSN